MKTLADFLNALGLAAAAALIVSCGPDAKGSSTGGPERALTAEAPEGVVAARDEPADEPVAAADFDLASLGTADLGVLLRDRAAEADQYLFLLYFRSADENTGAMRKELEAAVAREGDRAIVAVYNADDPMEQSMVEEYGVDRAPTPLVLAVAPSGAVTKVWTGSFEGTELIQAFVSPCEADCLAHLQKDKLVLLCLQNADTKQNAEAMKGVKALASDATYAASTAIVTADPAAEAEAAFLKKLEVNRATTQAITVILAPPGQPLGSIVGATSKDTLLAAIERGTAACDPNSGCCPPK